MRQFLVESVAPFAAVLVFVAGATRILFDVPKERLAAPQQASAPGSSPATARAASKLNQTDEVLARALRTLNAGRVPTTRAPGATPEAAPDPNTLRATTTLAEAIRAVRDARTEEDIVAAEQKVRAARAGLEAACESGGGPLCDGAKQMRNLGY